MPMSADSATLKPKNRGTYPLLGRRGREEEARLPLLTVEHHGRRARPFVASNPQTNRRCELILPLPSPDARSRPSPSLSKRHDENCTVMFRPAR